MDFPLIYANGCSYSNPDFTKDKVHADYVGEALKGFVLNKSITGSCNRRIIRSSLYDIIKQRKLNPKQKIITIISLTFELRSELWVEDKKTEKSQESNFVTHHFSKRLDWKERLFSGKSLSDGPPNLKLPSSRFLDYYDQGRAYFFSPYAERINLLADLVMFTAVCEKHNINYLIFQAPKAEKLVKEHLLNSFKNEVTNNPQIFDLEKFGFLNWAHNQKFIPHDMLDTPEIGHYNSDAHEAFAKQVLLPKLEETGQI